MNSATIVQKLWNYCNVLRDDGMSYGDYVEQLTYLLFLKMSDERSRPPHNQASPITKGYDWPSLLAKDGDELFDHDRHTLDKLGSEKGTIGLIFAKAQNKFQDPAKLRRLVVDLINAENWSAMGVDVKGDACEYSHLIARDKASLDIFWLKDDALADSDNLPPPDVIAQEIVDDLEAALEQFRLIAADLQPADSAD